MGEKPISCHILPTTQDLAHETYFSDCPVLWFIIQIQTEASKIKNCRK